MGNWLFNALVLLGLLQAVASGSVNTPAPEKSPVLIDTKGGHLGCFNSSKLEGTIAFAGSQFQNVSVDQCASSCRWGNFALAVVTPTYECRCSSVIPSSAAVLPSSSCEKGAAGSAQVIYLHRATGTSPVRCHLANVPMNRSSFIFAYNEGRANFSKDSDGADVMTLRMDGGDGLRLTTSDGMFLYGQYQVAAKIAGASGAVTAFYVRSSDDYNNDNHGAFEEIDVEWLNGNPAVPNSIWLNSYHNGISNGETLVKPASYQSLLGLPPGADASNTWITYGFNWQPDSVSWHLNGRLLQRRSYNEVVAWKDMKGVPFSRAFRPPSKPSHVTISMWADMDQTRGFGGKLNLTQSPYFSYFKELRRVLCLQMVPPPPPQPPSPSPPQSQYTPARKAQPPATKAPPKALPPAPYVRTPPALAPKAPPPASKAPPKALPPAPFVRTPPALAPKAPPPALKAPPKAPPPAPKAPPKAPPRH